MNSPPYHRRRSIRLVGYDYSRAGAYYVTICTHGRDCIFGDVIDGEMCLNEWGGIADATWRETEAHFSTVVLDDYVVMPNHLHGIIWIMYGRDGSSVRDTRTQHNIDRSNDVRMSLKQAIIDYGSPEISQERSTFMQFGVPVPGSLSTIIGAFKSAVTRGIHERNQPSGRIWQGRFYDHIVRNETDLQRIRAYIRNNPMRWHLERDRDLPWYPCNDDEPT